MVLDEAAQKRAKAFCAERGIALNSARAKDPSTNEVTILYSWQKFFDANETQAAASLALDAIDAIYDLDDAQLSILRAWQ